MRLVYEKELSELKSEKSTAGRPIQSAEQVSVVYSHIVDKEATPEGI